MKNSIQTFKWTTVVGIMAGVVMTTSAHAGVKTYVDWFGNSIVEISDTKGISSYYVSDGSTGKLEKRGEFAAAKQSDCPTKITVNLGALAKHSQHFHSVIYGTCSATLAIKKFNARGNFNSVPTAAKQVGLMSSGDGDEQANDSEFQAEPLLENNSEPSIRLEYGNDEPSFNLEQREFSLEY